MAYDEALAERIRTVLGERPNVVEKKMFGGITFMVDDQMCCGVLKDDLIVKVGSEGWDEILAQPGVRPFDFSGRPMVGMVYVAPAGVSSDRALRGWIERGLEFLARSPKTTRRPRGSTRRTRA
ncbi:MAG: TfoX/Sxy family protein [Chloroflexi bacterium]|nr:TfoX/Sxy family protein [Chloroflexota bacterium]